MSHQITKPALQLYSFRIVWDLDDWLLAAIPHVFWKADSTCFHNPWNKYDQDLRRSAVFIITRRSLAGFGMYDMKPQNKNTKQHWIFGCVYISKRCYIESQLFLLNVHVLHVNKSHAGTKKSAKDMSYFKKGIDKEFLGFTFIHCIIPVICCQFFYAHGLIFIVPQVIGMRIMSSPALKIQDNYFHRRCDSRILKKIERDHSS